MYTEHIYRNPQFPRDISLMAAMWRQNEGLRLIRTAETAVIRVDRYDVIGSGGDLAEYILKRMYEDDLRFRMAWPLRFTCWLRLSSEAKALAAKHRFQ
jgi:hypothetical protein